jgi:hypothetical protein
LNFISAHQRPLAVRDLSIPLFGVFRGKSPRISLALLAFLAVQNEVVWEGVLLIWNWP